MSAPQRGHLLDRENPVIHVILAMLRLRSYA